MHDDRDQDYDRALAAFHRAVHAARQAWADSRDEPWPGWDNMSPRQLAELSIPELPAPPEPRPLSPYRDPLDPGFVLNRWLHPSMYTAVPDPSRLPGSSTRQDRSPAGGPARSQRRPARQPGTVPRAQRPCDRPRYRRRPGSLRRRARPRPGRRRARTPGLHEVPRRPGGAPRADTPPVPRTAAGRAT
jgi:hypothetical protein